MTTSSLLQALHIYFVVSRWRFKFTSTSGWDVGLIVSFEFVLPGFILLPEGRIQPMWLFDITATHEKRRRFNFALPTLFSKKNKNATLQLLLQWQKLDECGWTLAVNATQHNSSCIFRLSRWSHDRDQTSRPQELLTFKLHRATWRGQKQTSLKNLGRLLCVWNYSTVFQTII